MSFRIWWWMNESLWIRTWSNLTQWRTISYYFVASGCGAAIVSRCVSSRCWCFPFPSLAFCDDHWVSSMIAGTRWAITTTTWPSSGIPCGQLSAQKTPVTRCADKAPLGELILPGCPPWAAQQPACYRSMLTCTGDTHNQHTLTGPWENALRNCHAGDTLIAQ